MIVVDEVGVVLVCFAGKESVEAIKTFAQRPMCAWSTIVVLVRRCKVPFAEGKRCVSIFIQHL